MRTAMTALLATAWLVFGTSAALAAGGVATNDYADGVSALRAGDYQQASVAFQRVTAAAPRAPEGWRMLGAARAGLSDWNGARKAYANSVRLMPENAGSHAGLGAALARLKNPGAQKELAWLKARSKACGATCVDAPDLRRAIAQVEDALAGRPPTLEAAL